MGTTIDEYPNQGSVRKAEAPPFDMPSPAVEIGKRVDELEQAAQAVEETFARANRMVAECAFRLDQQERAILWLAKQPWEKEFKDWDELLAAIDAGTPKPMKFRETVPTPPPVRDIL